MRYYEKSRFNGGCLLLIYYTINRYKVVAFVEQLIDYVGASEPICEDHSNYLLTAEINCWDNSI